jgi:alcohol dehydrogenase class IV
MVTRFEFATAQRIVFGAGVLQEVGPLALALGKRPLIVTGRDSARCLPLIELLGSQGLPVERYAFPGEPAISDIRSGVSIARSMNADVIIAFGGGSALDGGKAVAALAANEGDLIQYLEVIGQGRSLSRRPLPCIAIPTTAGTGAEVTKNAVLASPEHGLKVSLRHAWMLPQVALVDPALTLNLPPEITASTGLDALTQLIEPFVSNRSSPMTDALCLEGLRRVSGALQQAWKKGHDLQAREDMALASLLGGMALANAGLGAVHGLAAPLGGLRPIPHGVACAALLPHVVETNLRMLRSRDSGHPVIAKFLVLARVLTGSAEAEAEDGVRWIKALVEELQIPRLGRYGLLCSDLEEVAGRALKASSMQANPVKLDLGQLREILAKAL